VRLRPPRARGSATEAGRDVDQALRWEREGALHQGRLYRSGRTARQTGPVFVSFTHN
jgi:hypothetical protein